MAHGTGGLPVLGNPLAPDIFADEAIAFDHINGTIRITLATVKPSEPTPPSPMQFVTTSRIVMTVPGAQRLCLALYDYLKKQGMDPAALAQGGQVVQ